MRQRQSERPVAEFAVVVATMVLKPSGVRGIGVEVLRADMVMLARNHLPKPREEALGWLVAVGFLFFLLVGETKRYLEYCKNSYPAAEYARKDEKKPSRDQARVIKKREQPLQSAIKTIDCSQPYGDDEYKTCQEWRTAKAAADQACVAQAQLWSGMIIGGLGIMGLIGTILYAAQSAQSAARAVSVASDNSRRELRAYIDVDKAEVTHRDEFGQLGAGVRLKNSGQTPAYDVVCWYNIGWRPFPFVQGAFNKPSSVREDDSRMTIGAGGGTTLQLETNGPSLTPTHDLYLRDQLAIVVYGEMTYTDTFGEKRITSFRMYNLAKLGSRRLRKAPEGNHST